MAIDQRITVSVARSKFNMLNGERLDFKRQLHIRYLARNLDHAVSFTTYSEIPAGSGLGSSAAFSAATALALGAERGESLGETEVMHEAYEAEYFAQGNGSPMDVSTSVHGGGLSINMPDPDGDFLWEVERDGRRWRFHNMKAPEMTFVIGNTGIKAPTGPLVDKVGRFLGRSGFAREVVDDIESITIEGGRAIQRRDVETLGRMMTADHKMLSILGVSCDALNKLVNASLPYSYGAKLTGSGGGGCMVALTDEPEKVCEAISSRGGVPYVVKTGTDGVRMEPGPPESSGLVRWA